MSCRLGRRRKGTSTTYGTRCQTKRLRPKRSRRRNLGDRRALVPVHHDSSVCCSTSARVQKTTILRDRQHDYYAIYQGPLGGVFDTHVPLTCGTSGANEHTFTPNPQSSYYLVVPIADPVELPVPDAWEGSYGQSSFGERERSDSPCWPLQGIQECAPN